MRTLAAFVALALASTAVAQSPAAQPLPGLYRQADGTTFIIGQQDSAHRYITFHGEVRALAGEGRSLTYGPALGVISPVEGTLERISSDSLVWKDSAGTIRKLARVPLVEEQVQWSNEGASLAGSVIIPPGNGPFPAVVMLQGSGPETRDISRALAYAVAAEGFVALIYDKRSCGESKGGSFNTAFRTLAGDALGGVTLLKEDPRIRADRIGLFGPSQGSWIALEASRLSDDVAFLILQSGDATSPFEQEMFRVPEIFRNERERGIARSRNLTDNDLAELEAFRRLKFETVMDGHPPAKWDSIVAAARSRSWFPLTGAGLPNADFWNPNGRYDPMPVLEQFRKPLLAVFGGRDVNKDVPRNVQLMREALKNDPDAVVRVFDTANHGLFETTTGMPIEIELPRLRRLAPGYADTLLMFLHSRVLKDRASH